MPSQKQRGVVLHKREQRAMEQRMLDLLGTCLLTNIFSLRENHIKSVARRMKYEKLKRLKEDLVQVCWDLDILPPTKELRRARRKIRHIARTLASYKTH